MGPIPGSTTNQVASDTSSQSAKRHTRPPRGNSDFERALGSCWDAIKIHAGKAAVKKLLAREFPGITDAVGDIGFANDAVNIVYETQSGELIQVPFDFSKFVYSMLEDVGGKTKNPVLELTGLIGQPATDCLQAALWLTQQAGKKWGSQLRARFYPCPSGQVRDGGGTCQLPACPTGQTREFFWGGGGGGGGGGRGRRHLPNPRVPRRSSPQRRRRVRTPGLSHRSDSRGRRHLPNPRVPRRSSPQRRRRVRTPGLPRRTDPETATVSSRPVPSIRCAITAVSANSRLAPTDRSAATTTTASFRLARLDRSETATVSVSSPPARPDRSATAAVSANSRLVPTGRSVAAMVCVSFRLVRRGRSVAAMVCVSFRRVRRGRSVAAMVCVSFRACPSGQVRGGDGVCQLPACPSGQVRGGDGACQLPACPSGQVRGSDGVCELPPCPPGQTRSGSQCVPFVILGPQDQAPTLSR